MENLNQENQIGQQPAQIEEDDWLPQEVKDAAPAKLCSIDNPDCESCQ